MSLATFARLVRGSRAALIPLAMGLAAGCVDGTGPDGGADTPTHPMGTVRGRATLAGRLDGIGVTAGGVALVSRVDAGLIGRFAVDAPATSMTPLQLGAEPRAVELNRAGTVAYIACGNDVYVIDATSGALKTKHVLPTRVYQLAVAPDESRLFLTAATGRVLAIPSGSTVPQEVSLAWTAWELALSPSGDALYVATVGGPVLRLDPASLAVVAQSTVSRIFGEGVAVSPDGTEVYVATDDGMLHFLDATTLAVRGSIELPVKFSDLAMSPDGRQLYATASTGELVIVDRLNRTIVSRLALGGVPIRVAFDGPGRVALVANESGWVDVIR